MTDIDRELCSEYPEWELRYMLTDPDCWGLLQPDVISEYLLEMELEKEQAQRDFENFCKGKKWKEIYCL